MKKAHKHLFEPISERFEDKNPVGEGEIAGGKDKET
jgi:hypothetical protein